VYQEYSPEGKGEETNLLNVHQARRTVVGEEGGGTGEERYTGSQRFHNLGKARAQREKRGAYVGMKRGNTEGILFSLQSSDHGKREEGQNDHSAHQIERGKEE